MSVKVSIVLPSLNVHQYIRECVESVKNQSLKEIEIICVDAGSNDGTLEIIEELACKDNRIKVIHSDKRSYGYQMNIGMNAACGEYIGIVETDDYVPANMYEELYEIAKEKDLDFIKANFFRFTGEGENISKALYELAGPKYTNRVINIVDEQECFNFTMNTWNGIYKKQFLIDYDIKHNETPGASYQDNGFWFQTFMYAKRGYFYNKPYYMNRRDNPGSSVYSKSKVYCICDEYERLWDIIQKNSYLKNNFRFIYAKQCFRAYKGNLNRISEEYREEFLAKFAEWFRILREENALDYSIFQINDWNMLMQIMQDSKEYYERYYYSKEILYSEIKKYDHIIIYGAGLIGRRVFDELTYCDNPAHVDYFAVSKKNENYAEYRNTKICDINELLEYKDDYLVVIATMSVYHREIGDILAEKGFKNIIIIPEDNKIEEDGDINFQLSKWYERITGMRLNIDSPSSVADYLQNYKLKDDTDQRKKYIDKLQLRVLVQNKLGDKYLMPVVGIYQKAEDIPFETLEVGCFVRCTHGSGMHITIDCSRSSEEIAKIRRNLDAMLKKDYAISNGYEMAYSNISGRLIVEPLIDGKKQDVYKVVCFGGKAKLLLFDSQKNHYGNYRRDIFDTSWNRLTGTIKWSNAEITPEKPSFLVEMIAAAEKIANDFPLIVVHFINTQDGIKISECKFNIENGLVNTNNKELEGLVKEYL